MPLFKFRVTWADDDNVCRDIEILSSQSFLEFHNLIQSSFGLKAEWPATFYVLNEQSKRTYSISSLVEKNIKDAPALSCKKTPVGAMVSHPSQEFIYGVEHDKEWDFVINLITLEKDGDPSATYPRLVRSEGISPMEIGVVKTKGKEKIVDVEELYDLKGNGDDEDDNSDGFGFDDEGASDDDSDYSNENEDGSYNDSADPF